MGFDISAHETDITRLVRRASRHALDWFRRPIEVANKLDAGFDPVTEADRAVEDQIRGELSARFADHAIYGEERGTMGDGPCRWTIDPIDGTRAFITGQPMWGTLVGFQVDDRPVAGWMHAPVLDETYLATPTGGRLVFGDPDDPTEVRPLTTTECTALGDAIVLCTHPEMYAPGPEAERWAQLESSVRMVRYGGDCVNYGLLATGHADLVIENGLAPYDIVPLLAILAAAGVTVSNLDGTLPLDGGFVIAAATPELHDAALTLLRP